MKPLIVSTSVARRPEEVFSHLAVLASHETFTDHFITDWQASGPTTGIGAMVRAQVRSPLGREPIEVVIVEADPPSLIVERTTAANGHRVTRGSYHLGVTGAGGTQVTLEIVTERAPKIEQLIAPLVRIWLRRVNIRAMARLRAELEHVPQVHR